MPKYEAPKVASGELYNFHTEEFVAGTSKSDQKLILVVLTDDAPVFEFRGAWTGKDLKDVHRLFRREYMKHQRNMRRETPPMKEE